MTPVRVIFFDLGDTLVEIAPDIVEDSTRQIAALTGHSVSVAELKQAERAEWLSRPPHDFLWVRTEEQERTFWEQHFYPSVLQRLGISAYPPQLVQLLAARAMDPRSFVPFPEVQEVLKQLKRAGIELGMISNSFPSAERILRHLNLECYFKYIIFSHQVGVAKPDPEIYRAALRSASIRPDEALFVDDRGPLVQGAMEVGIPSLLINRNGCSNGRYGKQIRSLEELLSLQLLSRADKMRRSTSGQKSVFKGSPAITPGHIVSGHTPYLVKGANTAMGYGKKEIKIFIASPSDVLPEREAAYQVIDDVNQIIASLEQPFVLEVYAWEGRTHPDVGLPQQVILRQIPIEECDVFIGIFWKRFGTPPGTRRPRDGRPYLSGTEEEIDKAFEARRRSPDDRPIIMLYRKMDSFPPFETQEECEQYARVVEFFRQCEPDGEHPALVARFEGDQFRTLLRGHLLQVIKEEVEKCKGEPPREPPPSSKPPYSFDEAMARWLKLVGLRDNPFQEHRACNREQLSAFFVPVGRLRMSELVNDPQPWVIFGDEGCGKTSLRMMVATRCHPQTSNSDVFCVECGANELDRMMGWVHSQNAASRKRLGFPTPELTPACPGRATTTQVQQWILAYMALVSQNLDEKLLESLGANLKTSPPLEALVQTVRNAGFRHILCLIDEVDMLPVVRGDPAKMADLLAQLMDPELREVDGIAFRYFLPAYLEPILHQRRPEFRLDRCRVAHLQWGAKDLRQLLTQRLIAFSQHPGNLRYSLGELCDPQSDLAERLEDELIALAEGNPRAVVYLADQLFRFHCQEEPVQRWIRPETWEQVKAEWWLRGRAQILGLPGGKQGFYLCGDQIYFEGRPITLPARYHALLRRLVQARGAVCSRAELARAGWPEDDPSGVTERAIDEAVRRLKKKLAEQGINPEWIETVRGRGYRVRNP